MADRVLAEPGDVLFYRETPGSGFFSHLAVKIQDLRGEGDPGMRYYHVSIVGANVMCQYESTWPKSRQSPIDWELPGLELWRVSGVTMEQSNNIVARSMNMVGEWYDVGNLLFGFLDFDRAEICTTFAAKALEATGLPFSACGGRFLTPNELAKNPYLYKVA